MPISASDLDWFYSGGSGNTDPAASIGLARSTTQIPDDTLHALFANFKGSEATAGITKYRCVYVRNSHATLTLSDPQISIDSSGGSFDTQILVSKGPSGKNGTEVEIENDRTEPVGVDFQATVSIDDLAPGDFFPLWFSVTIPPGTEPFNSDTHIIDITGDDGT